MAKVISVKMNETLFREADQAAKSMGMARNAYINKALILFTRLYKRKALKRELEKESRIVSQESREVLAEFERLRDSIP